MKVVNDDGNIIVFLNKYLTLNFDYHDTFKLQEFLEKIIDKLYKYYDISIKGYYDAYIYIDKYYGIMLKLIDDNYDTFIDTVVDIKTSIEYINLLYEIEDIIPSYFMHKIYLYNDKLYLELNNDLEDIDMSRLLENSKIIYKEIDNIKRNGYIIKNMI